MAAKLAKLETLEEGEYEMPFGKVIVSRADGGYKITIYINERAVGRAVAAQILQSLLAGGAGRPV
jgi:hypothetical protein